MTQNVFGSRGWVDQREAELAGQRRCAVMSVQVAPPSVERYMPAVVLLVERLGLAGRHRELVDALAGLRVRVRAEVGADALVARLPGRAAVARLEHADRRDPDPRPLRVGRVRDDRVEDQPAGAGLPGRAGLVVRAGPRRGSRSRRRRRSGTARPARRRRAASPSGPVARLQTVGIGSTPLASP